MEKKNNLFTFNFKMKKFLLILSLFLFPIIFLQIFTWLFYTDKKGDLLRMGYIFNRYPNYREIFNTHKKSGKIYFSSIMDLPKKKKYKIITIGDSFSEQGEYGYQNILAKNNHWDILHIDRKTQDNTTFYLNQIQFLLYLTNGDFFENYQTEYVILQNIERHFVEHSNIIKLEDKLTMSGLIKIIEDQKRKVIPTDKGLKFPSQLIFKFPYFTYNYFTKNDYCFDEKVNKTLLDEEMFSPYINELLFYTTDTASLKYNNDIKLCSQLNNLLNLLNKKLNKKGIKLIVMPSPDKFDIYYENIINRNKYPRPLFFENMNKLQKDYIYIDTRAILKEYIHNQKDIYYYDDTHWTPVGVEIISKSIKGIIEYN